MASEKSQSNENKDDGAAGKSNDKSSKKSSGKTPREQRKEKAAFYLKQLRIQLYVLIVGGMIAGGLYGPLSDHPNHDIALIGEWTYFIYEYFVRTISTVIGFYFTVKYYKITKKTFSRNRKLSFLGLSVSAVIIMRITGSCTLITMSSPEWSRARWTWPMGATASGT